MEKDINSINYNRCHDSKNIAILSKYTLEELQDMVSIIWNTKLRHPGYLRERKRIMEKARKEIVDAESYYHSRKNYIEEEKETTINHLDETLNRLKRKFKEDLIGDLEQEKKSADIYVDLITISSDIKNSSDKLIPMTRKLRKRGNANNNSNPTIPSNNNGSNMINNTNTNEDYVLSQINNQYQYGNSNLYDYHIDTFLFLPAMTPQTEIRRKNGKLYFNKLQPNEINSDIEKFDKITLPTYTRKRRRF